MSYKRGGARHHLAGSGGYAEVLDDVMTVLANAAEYSGEIDIERARQARERAEKKMAGLNRENEDFAAAEAALRRALVRLQVAGKEARK